MSSFVLLSRHFLRLQSINTNQKMGQYYKLINKSSLLLPFHNSIARRFMFTDEVLGIDKYLDVRHRIVNQFGDMKTKFFERMSEYAESKTNMIFTEDLKNVIFLAENKEDELNLITKMVKKFHSQNQSLRFGTFVFGPVIMRLLHHIGNSDLAVALLKDPELNNFFNQLSSVTIAMNLLYKNEKYEEVIDLLNYVQKNIPLETKYPRDCVLLVIASCYKINTPQSFDIALNILKNVREIDAKITRKTICLFAGLALNQNQPSIALEILSLAGQTNYITVRNLRLSALVDIKRFDDVFTILKLILNRDAPTEIVREKVLEETLNRIKAAVNSANDKELSSKFSQIERGLVEGNYVQSISLDSLLTTPIIPISPDKLRQQNYGYRNNKTFPGRRNDGNETYRARQGLRDPDVE